jgi:NADPH-dependent curcumin reductase CurA
LFYAGAAGTALLGGLAIWSGIDTLDARGRLPGKTEEANDSVRARALRTDALLAGTLVLAAATTYVGLAQISWGQASEPVALGGALGSQGAVVTARGRF